MFSFSDLLKKAALSALALWHDRGLAAERQRAADACGDFVAEVWLEWLTCRGSTMYRGRFATAARAEAHVRGAARLLDTFLPKSYLLEDWSGKPYREDYDFGIHFGVRPLTTHEREHGVSEFLTTRMPGHRGHQGEHRCAHPSLLEPDTAAAAQLRGYRV